MAATDRSEIVRFFNEFLSNPREVGAIAPSSTALARKIADWIDWTHIRTAVEYGPGTGALTEVILRRIQPGAQFLAVEQSSLMASTLQERLPQVDVVVDSVENIVNICRQAELPTVDFVLSGLPWANFPERQQERLMEETLQVLSPSGYFATFAYFHGLSLPAGRRFRRRIASYFSKVERSRIVWNNMPPAFVYRCQR